MEKRKRTVIITKGDKKKGEPSILIGILDEHLPQGKKVKL